MKINLGSGGDSRSGYDNLDIFTGFGAIYFDFDDRQFKDYADSSVEEIVAHGCLNEFSTSPVIAMSEFWRVLKPGGKLDIIVAVVDNGLGAFRDPVAKRYLHSEWVQYFLPENKARYDGGKGLGFVGAFRCLFNEVAGERHQVILEAIK